MTNFLTVQLGECYKKKLYINILGVHVSGSMSTRMHLQLQIGVSDTAVLVIPGRQFLLINLAIAMVVA